MNMLKYLQNILVNENFVTKYFKKCAFKILKNSQENIKFY